jgi:hypothetical protein
MWGLEAGKPFNPDYPENFLNRVREDGIFENLGKTATSQHIDPVGRFVDVKLIFGAAAQQKTILKSDPQE